MKLWNLAFYFLAGSIGVTTLGWIFSLTPGFIRFSAYGAALFIIAIGGGFFLDDPISEALEMELSQWYAILFGSAIAMLCGVAVLAGVLINGQDY